jgi:hypothetical protein
VLLAYLSLDSLVALIPLSLPANSLVRINATVLAFALTLSVITAVLFGLVPALKLSRAPRMISSVLAVGGRSPFCDWGYLQRLLRLAVIALGAALCSGPRVSRRSKQLLRIPAGAASLRGKKQSRLRPASRSIRPPDQNRCNCQMTGLPEDQTTPQQSMLCFTRIFRLPYAAPRLHSRSSSMTNDPTGPNRDRRSGTDRRAHSRSGRRAGDSAERCPRCASCDLERTGAMAGVSEYHCRACEESWVIVSRSRRA